ncbi:MAG: flagellin [Oscillospiraceae bacterium]|nr:flagellin [Oscillospiraceae bacterium]
MRINNNIGALNSQRQLGKNNDAITNRLEKLSSGKNINRSADNAAGLAISEKMRTQILGTMTASRNTQDAVSLIQVAEGGLQSMHGMLQRSRELAVQSANGTNDDNVDRRAIQGEFANIVNEIDDTANTTQFNGMNVLDGTGSPVTIQAGPNSDDTVDINIGNMTAEELLGLEGEQYNEATDVNLATTGAASNAIDTIDNAINDVSMQRAELGAMQNRLEFRMQALDIQAENASAAESRIRDTDMAKTMTELTAKNILQRASTAMLAQANAIPQNVVGMLS